MWNHEQIKQRLMAALDYDGIPECDRKKHLMRRCGLSRYMAQRALNGIPPKAGIACLQLADALDVDFSWFYTGELKRLHARTWRIHIQQIKYYPKEATDRMMRLVVAQIAGNRKARNLVDLVAANKMTFYEAALIL